MAKEYTKVDKLGSKSYFKDPVKTILHRRDGPAIEHYEGSKQWWVNGRRHRLDGPAFEYSFGDREWYVNGIFIFNIDEEGKLVARM